ncbi:MAG: GNAT family N-acetyltransferase [Methylocystis sp.]
MELSGRGVGSRLVDFALNKARERKQKVIPTCSFV